MTERYADSEIDEMIARLVMRWRLFDHGAGYTPHYVNDNGDHMCNEDDWRPTDRIDQAWQVLEKTHDRFDVYIVSLETEADEWHCWVAAESGTHHGRDKSAAMAICLACLVAVGVDATH